VAPAGADAFLVAGLVAGPQAWNAVPADIKLTDSCITFRKNPRHTFLEFFFGR